jgi:hypothetical protein
MTKEEECDMRLFRSIVPLVAAVTVLALPLSASPAAVAQSPTSSSTDRVDAPATPERIVNSSAEKAAAPPCWTSFNPPAPQGASMVQTYNNCSDVTVTVTPAYSLGGSIYVFVNSCVTLGARQYVEWYYGSTVRNAVYTTVVCR